MGIWRLLTSVDFAVAQIIVLALLAVVGMTIRQLPDFAFRSAGDYAMAMDAIHARYDPLLGAGLVDILERLSVFAMFRSIWFSAGLTILVISIVVCTLDRTPKLWRGVSDIRVAQPEPYFDPRLPDRAAMTGLSRRLASAASCAATGSRCARRRPTTAPRYLYGDRHQYTKMATLFTHTGLVLFLVAAAVTSRLGDEQGLVVRRGRVAHGPADRHARPAARQEPRLRGAGLRDRPGRPTSRPISRSIRDGQEIARKTIRVNDPLSVGGYTFHQNGFGPGAAPARSRRGRKAAVGWRRCR